MEIKDKTALVTGGAHRVGKAIGLALAEAGANLVINYHGSADAALETVSEAEALGVGAMALKADVSDPDQVQAMVDAALDRFGAIQILVNGASLWRKTPFPMDDFTDWHTVTRILIDGSLYCANAVAPGMLAKGEGAMVNIVDLSVWDPMVDRIAHTVGKAALWAMTKQLAVELAPSVHVNAVAPGPVLPPPDYTPKQTEIVGNLTLKRRWGSAQDVVDAVMYLVRADYVTAEVLVVDGGQRYGHRAKPEG